MFTILAQIYPPTPTALPPPQDTGLDPLSFSLWDGADDAIQAWHMAHDLVTVIQIIILLAMVMGTVMAIKQWLVPIVQEKMDTF